MLLGSAVFVLVRRQRRARAWQSEMEARLASAKDLQLVNQLASATMERAMAKFVLGYSQLVPATSMAEYVRGVAEVERPREALRLGDEVGRGQSGRVVEAQLLPEGVRSVHHPGVQAVAVKMRIGAWRGPDSEIDELMLLEALLLRALQHRSIVALMAIVSQSAPVLVCTELMQNGNLRNFLRSSRPGPNRSARTAVSSVDLASIASAIASAMSYLEHHGVIHRDVAARNVLVGSSASEVKLADLGAARSVFKLNAGVYRSEFVWVVWL
jgi:serine/threonine protein kinase